MAPIAILIKFLVPVLAFYFVQKWMLNALRGIENFKVASNKHAKKPTDEVIEICPDCGNVKLHKHKCKFS